MFGLATVSDSRYYEQWFKLDRIPSDIFLDELIAIIYTENIHIHSRLHGSAITLIAV